MPKEWFKNKICLDAGCGNGRYSYAMHKLGAKVYAVDISDTGLDYVKKFKDIIAIKGDLNNLMFNEESFDLVFSSGVLHHLENSEEMFKKLILLLKKNGIIYIKVYEWKNPIKLFITELIRKSFNDNNSIWNFSKKLADVGKNKILYNFLGLFMFISDSAFTNFDHYATPINHYYKEEEIVEWFEENGLKDIKIINPRRWETHKNMIQRFFRGKNGGFIRISGIK